MISASSGRVRTILRVSGMIWLTKRSTTPRTWGIAQRELPLGGLHPSRPGPVPGAGCARTPFIPGALQEGGDLILQRALEDELGSQSAYLSESIWVADPIREKALDLFLDMGARCYSVHGRSPSFGSFVPTSGAYASPFFQQNPDATRSIRTNPQDKSQEGCRGSLRLGLFLL